jgi:hypothetical protein
VQQVELRDSLKKEKEYRKAGLKMSQQKGFTPLEWVELIQMILAFARNCIFGGKGGGAKNSTQYSLKK